MKEWGDRGRWGIEETEEDEGLRKTLYSVCVCLRERERERERDIVMWLGKNKKLQDVYYPGTQV